MNHVRIVQSLGWMMCKKKNIAVKKQEMRVIFMYRLPFHGFLNQVSVVWMLNWLVNYLSVICSVELLNKPHGCYLSLSLLGGLFWTLDVRQIKLKL